MTSADKTVHAPELIAHRGYQLHYPENTVPAIEAALYAGAHHVEFDVQLTADLVPVVCHDATLERTAKLPISILDTRADALKNVSAHEPARLGSRFANTPVPTLAEICGLLARWPEVTGFVEIKTESTERHGIETVVERVLAELQPRAQQFRVISFDADTLRVARRQGAHGIGWVIGRWNEDARVNAERLSPDYLFCNYRKLPEPPAPLWPGPWRWALYDVTDPALALTLAARGAELICTFAIGEMLADPRLRP
jgi:glycerophosphoryl diester phosphodiesterase